MANKHGIPKDWLRRRGTPDEFEREALERKAQAFNVPLAKVVQKFGKRPFGGLTEKWRVFTEQLSEEDELWFFSSPDHTFAAKLGCMGYAIVRAGIIRDTMVTLRT
jgi:hypothetical protein